MREWLALSLKPSVVRRSVKYSLIVGFILTLINHSDAILSGHVTLSRSIRILLTFLVPYTVSTLSSVGALIEQRRAHSDTVAPWRSIGKVEIEANKPRSKFES